MLVFESIPQIIVLLFLSCLGNLCLVIICFPVDDTASFKVNLNFLIYPFP